MGNKLTLQLCKLSRINTVGLFTKEALTFYRLLLLLSLLFVSRARDVQGKRIVANHKREDKKAN